MTTLVELLDFIERLPVVSPDPHVQSDYIEMRVDGQSHNMAEVLALRKFPGTTGTDRAFMEGRHLDGAQFEGQPGDIGKQYCAAAARAGVNTAGKWYSGTLARFPMDPQAWVGGTADVKAVCDREGWTARGSVNTDAPKYAETWQAPAKYEVAPEIVETKVRETIAAIPELASKRDEVKAAIGAKMAGSYGAR